MKFYFIGEGTTGMESIKILHCADMHFDTPFTELPHIQAEKRKEDLKETFSRIIELAKKEDVSLLFISGDLFDNERIRKTTVEYLMRKFQEISLIHVFISPGNHDPYHNRSFYNIVSWPENVHVFQGGIEKIFIPQKNVCIYGAAFSQSHQKTSLLKNFHVDDENVINIMALHGDVVSGEQESNYNPIAIEDIRNSGLDYLALGHVHSYSGIFKEENTYWSYSGNPEGRGFDEVGSKGILIGEVGKGWCNLEFREVCKRKYFDKEVDISGIRTYEEIIDTIHEEVTEQHANENLYKIRLTGEIQEDFHIYPEILEEKLKNDFFFIKIVDYTQIQIDYESLSDVFSLKGIFVKEMMQRIQREEEITEKEILEEALKIGLQALEGGEIHIE